MICRINIFDSCHVYDLKAQSFHFNFYPFTKHEKKNKKQKDVCFSEAVLQ